MRRLILHDDDDDDDDDDGDSIPIYMCDNKPKPITK
jgi:hypothetical protein